MKRVFSFRRSWLALAAVFLTSAAGADDDVFKGKLFAPNIILEHRAELALSKEQFTKIRAAVVEVQAQVAEHEWDMQEAYVGMMAEIDKSPIDEAAALSYAQAALLAENKVKSQQMSMLIRLRNLLTDKQIARLKALEGE